MTQEPQFREHFGICSTARYEGPIGDPPIRSEHPDLELLFVLEHPGRSPFGNGWGPTKVRLPRRQLEVERGRLVVYNGREKHESFSPSDYHHLAVTVSEEHLADLLRPAGLEAREIGFDVNDCELSPGLRAALAELMALREVPSVSRETYDLLTTDLAVELLFTLPSSHSEKLKAAGGTGYYPSVIAKAKRFLLETIHDESFDLDLLSSEVGLSKFHLIRSFKASLGTTPARLRQKVRNDLAKRGLLESGASILEISERLGFGCLSTFNKSFRRLNGTTPSEFRASRI